MMNIVGTRVEVKPSEATKGQPLVSPTATQIEHIRVFEDWLHQGLVLVDKCSVPKLKVEVERKVITWSPNIPDAQGWNYSVYYLLKGGIEKSEGEIDWKDETYSVGLGYYMLFSMSGASADPPISSENVLAMKVCEAFGVKYANKNVVIIEPKIVGKKIDSPSGEEWYEVGKDGWNLASYVPTGGSIWFEMKVISPFKRVWIKRGL